MLSTTFDKPVHETTVAVAMSGGVDSSTVAALLCEAGYKVVGITLQLYDAGMIAGKKGACCAGIDVYDAKMVANRIGIPHYVLDYESKFKSAVIDDFIETYLQGETPTPCIRCNQSVKFKDLLQVAKGLKADCLATGHYVSKVKCQSGFEMHKAKDHNKDQSYFLFATTKEQLEYLEFPLGNFDKSETRRHALRLGLEIADKPDSQDICFVNGSYASVIEKIRPNSLVPGVIMHVDGYKLGQHKGVIGYTIGQRRGIGLASGEPLYVIKIDSINNILYVGPEHHLYKSKFRLKDVNFLSIDEDFEDSINVQVKIRSAASPVRAQLFKSNTKGEIFVELLSLEKSITPGQACVFYDDHRLLGGGWISKL